MTIHFYLRFHSVFGQRFFLSGNIARLGNGNEAEALPMEYLDGKYWYAKVEMPESTDVIRYKYVFEDQDGILTYEWQADRVISRGLSTGSDVHTFDFWNYPGTIENAFFTKPFQNTLLKVGGVSESSGLQASSNFLFRVKAPLLKPNEIICLLGEGPVLGNWDPINKRLFQRNGEWFEMGMRFPPFSYPMAYKYGIYDLEQDRFVTFEDGENRHLPVHEKEGLTLVQDGFAHFSGSTFRAAGVAIPVFSLRSDQGFGIGEFTDLPALVDWCVGIGMKMIQLLPINDTTSTYTWKDSYPYAPISVFALHPIYLNLEEVAGESHAELLEGLNFRKETLNELPEVNYEAVLTEKLAAASRLYQCQKESWIEDPDYQSFFDRNKDWLIPYAAFCKLRNEFGTADFSAWGIYSAFHPNAISSWFDPSDPGFDDVGFHLFIQYHLSLQLSRAVSYAHEKGVILKGDLPIGIYRYSCDAWVSPEQYNMDSQAGAPPDDFAVKGQNWGFPTYNWPEMQANGFSWWKDRFAQMSDYFDAFRIDHILGFFRIWSIPLDAVEGIMGYFVPCIPVHLSEFSSWGIPFDRKRFTSPFITDELIEQLFGADADYARVHFLDQDGDDLYTLKTICDTQRKVEELLGSQPEMRHWKQALFDLISNVLLFPEEGDPTSSFHFRIRMEETYSFQQLDAAVQASLKELYINYFYRRQDEFWRKEALQKLPAIKSATDMLICGEDLGMVPESVPGVMQDLGFLSLEIQRMPKDPARAFFHPRDAPYLSVVTPSTHDMSTIRGWWEEDRKITQRFFNQELGQAGTAPVTCEPWINKAIIVQHVYSPAMWSIFQLQDLMGMDKQLRRDAPQEERINIPANPKHYWRYRMHLTIQDLQGKVEFNQELRNLLEESGRA